MVTITAHRLDVFDTSSPVSGAEKLSLSLSVASARLSVRDIIRFRVEQEVEQSLRCGGAMVRALVPLTEEERLLNGEQTVGDIDVERYVQRALRGFEENAFFVLDAERQLDNLDEEIDLHHSQAVTFYRLVPLVGG
ncbi:MAG: hypothetical protein K0U93_06515 [Gammaproteobacteria bacterium]|nr:hypothetical protein [Gammaproteobacteria bacterium]